LAALVVSGVVVAGGFGVGSGGLQGGGGSGSGATGPAASFGFVDAGIVRINEALNIYDPATINYPGTEASKYMFLACSTPNVRLGAQCSGGAAYTLDMYAVNGNIQWSVSGINGDLVPTGDNKAAITNQSGTITLAAGTGTATVTSGARCVCTDQTAVAAVRCVVSTTTLTATGTGTDVITYLCDR
jgi:hypothetical protein